MQKNELPDGLFDLFADAVLVVDGDGRIRFANAACLKILGYEPTELVGQCVEILVPDEVEGHDRMRRVIADGTKARGMGSGLELNAVLKSGERIPVDITLSPFVQDDEPLVVAAVRDMRNRNGKSEILRVQATALESAANGIVITTRAGTITWANPAACRMTGYEMDELVGRNTRILKSGEHPPELYEELWETILRGEVWSGTIINRRKDGSFYHEEQTIAPVVDDDGEITHFIAIKQDVSVRVGLEKELQRLARVDTLTGCANRHHLLETANSELGRAHRFGYPVSVVIFDLDRFKSINDRFGHSVGDRVLCAFVEAARAQLRDHDIIGRYGGEEFVAVLPHTDIEGAFLAAERIRESFGADTSILPEGRTASVSGGVVEVERGSLDIHRALRAADRALYRAKEEGRNRIVLAFERERP
jgi:diguanylate cyclase (GGDEF)-like protein/PAS domain S-box-containing protein